ncbi:eukaryotic cytochrome b561-domain-containing protein [Phycomyces nitens]|nr:eukaryotic cytochrome b561-domain-containing protein [Phycomyces nitens]
MSSPESPLLGPRAVPYGPRTKQDRLAGYATHFGVALFAALILSVLVRLPLGVFTYHPVGMTLFVVLITEGISLLQPTSTPEQKAKGQKNHAMVQTIAYCSAIVGFTAIFYNKVLSSKPHFTSSHAQLGVFVFSFLFVQLVFGIIMAVLPRLSDQSNAKSLWKYHRVSGYILLVLIWTTAQLGVRADYMFNNLWSPSLIWLHWVVVVLVGYGIVRRIRLEKWGLA